MNISLPVIKSISNMYSVEELQQNLQRATLALLENPDSIVSASTGSWASYSKQINMTAQDMVELFSYALEYKQTGSISTGGSNIMPAVTFII